MAQIIRMMGAMMRCFAHEIGILPSIVCPTLRYIIHGAAARQASRPALIFCARSAAPDYFQDPETEAAVMVTL
jgi:hypothetical protein